MIAPHNLWENPVKQWSDAQRHKSMVGMTPAQWDPPSFKTLIKKARLVFTNGLHNFSFLTAVSLHQLSASSVTLFLTLHSGVAGRGTPSYLTFGNELSKETHVPTKQKALLGRGARWRPGDPGNCSAMRLAVLGFMVMGLVSRLSLANHLTWLKSSLTQGPSWWCVHLSAKMCNIEKDSGRFIGNTDWHLHPPSSPSQILLVTFWHNELCSLSGPLISRQLMQVLGQGGQFQLMVP